ncbi:NAD(P)H-hydrate dehydratase [Streptosporangium roseum]|uniref:Bifunctional NAD(P)H-hydrate repair enzyme n=1 Tax=Streptosporangium roseum (strain ATCC 12428 / DSM 43021 / JCM 3005 / KCTC 9067 / NCIMB 10171 / NRRL 2505 / NI 9100) TaxID=479432 RepID=D2BBB6_STRRD|nr:NAD(P)H-hydrate dehydratase [Streptosporangium roseum]ACZ84139.1 YjeF-like protein [Streptosporangium roseum DSM 43021]
MLTAYTTDQIRAAEAALMARLPDGTLMERAAAGLAAICAGTLGQVYGSRVVLLIGGGDNGGDALYAGARLASRGARVDAILAGARVHGAGLEALRRAGGRVTDLRAAPAGGGGIGGVGESTAAGVGGIGGSTAAGAGGDAGAGAGGIGGEAVAGELVRAADLVVDGLVGIGGAGALREPYATLVELTAEAAGAVVAVDVPSGVDAGSGRVDGAAVRADVTVTFGAYKIGLLVDPGAEHAGRVELVDIGLGPHLPGPEGTALTDADVAPLLPRPGAGSDKYSRGVVGVAAGSHQYTGAAVLAVGGAIRAGAGMVRYAGVAEPVAQVRARWPEAVITPLEPGEGIGEVGRVQAWVLGPGLGTGPEALAVARSVLASDVPVLVDADALTLVSQDRSLLRRAAPVLITPHAGELSRLLDVPRARIEARRLEHVRRAAAELGVTVLLKGSTTLVAQEGRPVRINLTGSPWLATGGTGDVLAGLAGALLAGGLGGYDAASCAAHLHGIAGRHGPLAAWDVVEALPEVIRSLADRLRQGA